MSKSTAEDDDEVLYHRINWRPRGKEVSESSDYGSSEPQLVAILDSTNCGRACTLYRVVPESGDQTTVPEPQFVSVSRSVLDTTETFQKPGPVIQHVDTTVYTYTLVPPMANGLEDEKLYTRQSYSGVTCTVMKQPGVDTAVEFHAPSHMVFTPALHVDAYSISGIDFDRSYKSCQEYGSCQSPDSDAAAYGDEASTELDDRFPPTFVSQGRDGKQKLFSFVPWKPDDIVWLDPIS